jgi:N-ethylmaleimide reductase
MSDHKLFSHYKLGGIELKNRVVMCPLTRCRSTAEHVPTPIMIPYYASRATAGLLITEGTAPSIDGTGYARIPGIYNVEQTIAWRRITDAVHAKDGRIFIQLMHTGRVSHPLNMPPKSRILAPSAVRLSGTMWTDAQGLQPYPEPQAMTESDIKQAIESFAHAAALAMEAGFDGVELHGANGYLIDQFLNTVTNRRTDRWGGSVEARARFAIEVAANVVQRIGAQRVGIRVSPYGVFNDMLPDAEMDALYLHVASELTKIGLAYMHIVDHSSQGAPIVKPEIKQIIRTNFKGALILSGGYDRERADDDLAAGLGDLVAFGRPFISNPDLVRRLRDGIMLAPPDPATFYTPGEKGYIDYPVLS